MMKLFCYIFYFILSATLTATWNEIDPSPVYTEMNPNSKPSMVNSVNFHPETNRFCVTFTHNNQVAIYQIEEKGLNVLQVLNNPACPQHAIFSRDGQRLVVANWANETFNIYSAYHDGHFQQKPSAIIPYPPVLKTYRPHGIAFSSNGEHLIVAFGASKLEKRAVALFTVIGNKFNLSHKYEDEHITAGIPKGIAFTPNGISILVTFAETNSIAIYDLDWKKGEIIPGPRQILTQLSRPEDIKFTMDGTVFAVSNSTANTVAFYEFDRENNTFVNETPFFVLKNPESKLSFPHGLAFSSDGTYLCVTQFGIVKFDDKGNLSSWERGPNNKDSFSIFKLK